MYSELNAPAVTRRCGGHQFGSWSKDALSGSYVLGPEVRLEEELLFPRTAFGANFRMADRSGSSSAIPGTKLRHNSTRACNLSLASIRREQFINTAEIIPEVWPRMPSGATTYPMCPP